jgi:alanine racemase
MIGNICMDMTMINIDGLEASEGDEVIVFDNQEMVKKIAKTIGTIEYEILTGIGRRVKRVYFQE